MGSRATLGDLAGFACGFKSSTGACMVDGGPFDPDKAYKDSKLVSWCNTIST